MSAITFEILFILLLLLANGVFAMSELAILSSRKARLQQMCATGNARACTAVDLALAPDRFLSTIQIGITLVGILAGALGGATIASLASRLAACLRWLLLESHRRGYRGSSNHLLIADHWRVGT